MSHAQLLFDIIVKCGIWVDTGIAMFSNAETHREVYRIYNGLVTEMIITHELSSC